MAVTAWKYPTADGHIDDEWVNPQYAYTDNATQYAALSSADPLKQQDWYGFGFTSSDIPVGATIDGIEVKAEGYNNGAEISWDVNARLVKDISGTPTIVGDTQQFVWSTASWDAQTFGADGYKWGTTWTQAEIVDSDFGLWLDNTSDPVSGSLRVDYVAIRVYYTEAPTEIEHTSTCTIGVTAVSPVTFSLTAAFLATIGLTPSCRTFLDQGTTASGAPVEDSGWEVFTPNEDITTEWTSTAATHYTEIDDDPTSPDTADYVYVKSPNYTGKTETLGFSAPTAPTGATYSTIMVRFYPELRSGDQGGIWVTPYAGGGAIGGRAEIHLSSSGDEATVVWEFTGLSVSKADMTSLQLKIESDEGFGDCSWLIIHALDILGFWEATPTGITGSTITSSDDRSTTINSKDDRSISITSK